MGTAEDVDSVREGLERFWKRQCTVIPRASRAPARFPGLDYHALNAMLNLYGANGEIQFDKDREAAHQYFLQHVNQNTVFFHDLDEKLDYLVKNELLRARGARPVHP